MSDPIKKEVLVCVPRTNSDYSYSEEITSYIRELGDTAIIVDADSKDILKELDGAVRRNPFIKYAVFSCLESSKAVHHLWRHGILSLIIIPKCGVECELTENTAKYCFCVGAFMFPTHKQRLCTLKKYPDFKNTKYSIISPGSSEEFKECLKDIGLTLSGQMGREITDRKIISGSQLFNARFAAPWHGQNKCHAIAGYTTSWRTGVARRKPMPAFHPGIYAEACNVTDGDPFAHYISSREPSGAWNTETINPRVWRNQHRRSLLKSALHIHLFYPQMSEDLIRRIRKSRSTPDLFISVSTAEGQAVAKKLFAQFTDRKIEIRVVPNAGRDIGPLLTEYAKELQQYEVIGHVHTKKSIHQEKRHLIDDWCSFLFENMIGGKKPMIDIVLHAFEKDVGKGLIYADDPNIFGWMDNRDIAMGLMKKMGLSDRLDKQHINFPVGTMFWARPEALKPLFDLKLDWTDYPAEPLPNDGTMLHAIERIIPSVVKEMGYREAVTYVKGVSR